MCQSLRELDNQGTVFSCLAVTMIFIELDYIVRGGKPYLRTRVLLASCSANTARHSRASCIVILIAVSGVATPENNITH